MKDGFRDARVRRRVHVWRKRRGTCIFLHSQQTRVSLQKVKLGNNESAHLGGITSSAVNQLRLLLFFSSLGVNFN